MLAQFFLGKTASYGIPVIHNSDASSKQTHAIILCPTRELCLQIADDLNIFPKYIDFLHIAAVYVGTDIVSQVRTFFFYFFLILFVIIRKKCEFLADFCNILLPFH